MSTQAKGTLVVVRNPLEPSKVQRDKTEIDALRILRDVLPEEVREAPDQWAVIDGGKVVEAKDWDSYVVRPGVEVICVPRIGGKNAMSFAMGALLIGGAFLTGGTLAPILLSLGLGMVAQGLVGLFTKAPSGGEGGGDSRQSYGFGAITNDLRPGATIPVVYGQAVTGGLIVARSIATGYTVAGWSEGSQSYSTLIAGEADDEYLDQIILLSEGPVASVAPYRVNGGSPSAFLFTHDWKTGEVVQSPLNVFANNGTRSSYSFGTKLGEVVYTTQADDLTQLEIIFYFPGGLFELDPEDPKGERLKPAFVDIYAKIERLDSSGSVIGTMNTSFAFAAARKTPFRRTSLVNNLPAGRYQITLTRAGGESGSVRISDAVMLNTITEITTDQYTYPLSAMASVSRFPAKQAGGSIPTFSYLIEGKRVRQFSSVSVAGIYPYVVGFTQNPAWIALDILVSERYGMGNHVWASVHAQGTVSVTNGSDIVTGLGVGDWTLRGRPGMHIDIQTSFSSGSLTGGRVAVITEVLGPNTLRIAAPWNGSTASNLPYAVREPDIDIASFHSFSLYCDEIVPGNEVRAMFDGVFNDSRWTAWESAQKVCSVALGQPVKLGSRISVVWQAPAVPAQLFTSANIIPGSFKFTLPDVQARANYFQVAYLDRAKEFKAESVNWRDPDTITNREPEKRFEVEAFGVTRRSHAARLARWYRLINKGRGAIIEFEVGRDALACTVNDVILYQHDAMDSSWSGRCASSGSDTLIVLDQDVTLVPGTEYRVMLRHNGYWFGNQYTDGDLIEEVVVGGATVYGSPTRDIYVVNPLVSNARQGDVYALGTTSALPAKPYRIIEISRAQEVTAKIVAVEYDESAYDDSAIDVSQPVFSSEPLNPYITAPPQVTDITLRAAVPGGDGAYITWTPGTPEYLTTSVDIYEVLSNGQIVYLDNVRGGFYQLPEFYRLPGSTFTVKVVSVGPTGIRADVSAAPTATLTIPVAVGPPKPTGLELIQGGQGLGNTFVYSTADPEFRWRYRGETRGFGIGDLNRESLGVLSDGIDATFRDFEIRIYDANGVLKRTEYQYSNRYQYTTVKRTADGVGTTFTLKVRQRNVSGLFSSVAASITVSPAA